MGNPKDDIKRSSDAADEWFKSIILLREKIEKKYDCKIKHDQKVSISIRVWCKYARGNNGHER